MNTKHKQRLVFDFWKNNNLSQHYTLTVEEFISKWNIWREYQINTNKYRGQKWYEHYYGQQAVNCFIGDKEGIMGLQSVMEHERFNDLYELVREHF